VGESANISSILSLSPDKDLSGDGSFIRHYIDNVTIWLSDDRILTFYAIASLWTYQQARGLLWSIAVQLRTQIWETRSLSAKEAKPVFKLPGVGIETVEPTRELHDNMKLASRSKRDKKAERVARSNGVGWRKFFSASSWMRFLITFGVFGLFLHGLFVFFGVYDRNQNLPAVEHFILLIKLVVFIALMYLFYAMLMHYGPIREKVRGIFFLALAPVAAVCIFMIYGGGRIFGSFLPVLQFLTLTIGVGGFLLYVVGYTWVAGRQVKRDTNRHERTEKLRSQIAGTAVGNGLSSRARPDRRKVHKAGSLRLRHDDNGSFNGEADRTRPNVASRKARLPEI
tara:strand:- start:205996 stop:207015 length:1020 start_codon:yes stop_codon:yes gene_type:complete